MRLAPWLSFSAVLACCGGDPTVMVARVDQQVTGTAPFECSATPVLGPEGYEWCPYTTPGGSSIWSEEPTPGRLSFAATSPVDVRAGLAFQFDPEATLRGLADFEAVELDLDVTEGEKFELFLGQGPGLGCSYVFDRASSGPYRKDLGVADWCMPSQCGFDLAASGGMLLAHVPTESTLKASVTGLRFVDTGIVTGRARAMGAALGPGGFCWFLVGWTADSVVAGSPPSSSSVTVHATTTAGGVAGVAFELPSGFNLPQYQRLEVTGVVNEASVGSPFLIQGVNQQRGLVWQFPATGESSTYVANLQIPDSHFPADSEFMPLAEVLRFEIVISGAIGGSLDANLTDVQFRK
jgi:hypothetical protein